MIKVFLHCLGYGGLLTVLALAWQFQLISGEELTELRGENRALREQLQFTQSMQRGYEERFWHARSLPPQTTAPETFAPTTIAQFLWHKSEDNPLPPH